MAAPTDLAGRADRYAAVLLGGHLGDALGGPVETWSPMEIKRHYGSIEQLIAATLYRSKDGTIVPADRANGNWHAQQRAGEPSDDTILTLCVARTLADKGYDLDDLAAQHVAAIDRRRQPDGSITGGFGRTTLRAIERLASGIAPSESGVVGVGNAPPMKMAPVGLYAHATKTLEHGLRFAADAGRMTHRYAPSIVAGMTQAYAVHVVLEGTSKEWFLEDLAQFALEQERTYEPVPDEERLSPRLRWIARHPDEYLKTALHHLRNDGRAIASYPFAIFLLQRHWDTPLEGLIEAVNCGGDADTVGAMYGALAAARHGRFWPDAWEERLEERDACIALGGAIARKSTREREGES